MKKEKPRGLALNTSEERRTSPLASHSPLCKGLPPFLFLPLLSSPSSPRFHFSAASMHEAHNKLET